MFIFHRHCCFMLHVHLFCGHASFPFCSSYSYDMLFPQFHLYFYLYLRGLSQSNSSHLLLRVLQLFCPVIYSDVLTISIWLLFRSVYSFDLFTTVPALLRIFVLRHPAPQGKQGNHSHDSTVHGEYRCQQLLHPACRSPDLNAQSKITDD